MRKVVGSIVILAVMVAVTSTGTVTGQSPAVSPPADPSARPMLAPEGWMYATVEAEGEVRTRLDVIAVSPSGEVRLVSTIDDVTRDAAGRDLHTAYEDDGTIATVTTDGFLPVPLEWSDAVGGDQTFVRLFDLLAPDPRRATTDIEASITGEVDWRSVRSAADGRISMVVEPIDDNAPFTVQVLDPLSGQASVIESPTVNPWTELGWLEDASGWMAFAGREHGTLATDGVFMRRTPPFPRIDLARGAEQVSSSGRFLSTFDVGAVTLGSRPFDRLCARWWDTSTNRVFRPGTVWWDRCRDRGRVHDIRWDVDQKGVLVLVERGDRMVLVRRDRPRAERVLASFPAARLENARRSDRRIEVLGLAPGARPGELLLALRPFEHHDSIFFLSTIEQRLIEIKGDRSRDSVAFAGFATPPSDRDVSGLTPVALRPDVTPPDMLAPTDWMFAWVSETRERRPTSPIRVIAMSDRGEVREVATVRLRRSAAEEMATVTRVTTTGYVPIPTGDILADEGGADQVEIFNLRDPDSPPFVYQNEPGKVHDWRGMTSSPTGMLSVPVVDADGATTAMRLMAAPDQIGLLVPIQDDVDPRSEFVVDAPGWPAWRGAERSSVILRWDGTITDSRRRRVALARGAEQEQRGGDELGRVMGDQEVGISLGCPHDRIISRWEPPYRVWWDPCRDAGRLFDIRWDTDGSGVLFLVRRGEHMILGRSPRPGVHEAIASFPLSTIGGPRTLREFFRVEAVMEGRLPGELRIALATHGDLWLWSTLGGDPVRVPRAKGEVAGFAGFSVARGDPR